METAFGKQLARGIIGDWTAVAKRLIVDALGGQALTPLESEVTTIRTTITHPSIIDVLHDMFHEKSISVDDMIRNTVIQSPAAMTTVNLAKVPATVAEFVPVRIGAKELCANPVSQFVGAHLRAN